MTLRRYLYPFISLYILVLWVGLGVNFDSFCRQFTSPIRATMENDQQEPHEADPS